LMADDLATMTLLLLHGARYTYVARRKPRKHEDATLAFVEVRSFLCRLCLKAAFQETKFCLNACSSKVLEQLRPSECICSASFILVMISCASAFSSRRDRTAQARNCASDDRAVPARRAKVVHRLLLLTMFDLPHTHPSFDRLRLTPPVASHRALRLLPPPDTRRHSFTQPSCQRASCCRAGNSARRRRLCSRRRGRGTSTSRSRSSSAPNAPDGSAGQLLGACHCGPKGRIREQRVASDRSSSDVACAKDARKSEPTQRRATSSLRNKACDITCLQQGQHGMRHAACSCKRQG
jgi:hypothetical protein